MENKFLSIINEVINSISEDELKLCEVNVNSTMNNSYHPNQRRTMIAYDELSR